MMDANFTTMFRYVEYIVSTLIGTHQRRLLAFVILCMALPTRALPFPDGSRNCNDLDSFEGSIYGTLPLHIGKQNGSINNCTGFVYRHKIGGAPYIVSSRHCLEGLSWVAISVIEMKRTGAILSKRRILNFTTLSPVFPNDCIEVGAFLIPRIVSHHEIIVNDFCWPSGNSNHVHQNDAAISSFFKKYGALDQVITIGYPSYLQFKNSLELPPLVRSGAFASLPWYDYGTPIGYMDLPVYPGSSGSPVYHKSLATDRWVLVGIAFSAPTRLRSTLNRDGERGELFIDSNSHLGTYVKAYVLADIANWKSGGNCPRAESISMEVAASDISDKDEHKKRWARIEEELLRTN